MALTTDQQANIAFKQALNLATTLISRLDFQEPFTNRLFVSPEQIQTQYANIPTLEVTDSISIQNQIPANNLIFYDELKNSVSSGTTEIIQYYHELPLTAVTGIDNAFHNPIMSGIITNEKGQGYTPIIKDSLGNTIAEGQNDWLIFKEAGLLSFFTGVPSNMPPTISFYKYVGEIGVDNLTFDPFPVSGSTNPVESNGIFLNINSLSAATDQKLNITRFTGYTATTQPFLHLQNTDTGTTANTFGIGYLNTGNNKTLNALGDDININLTLNPKGFGSLGSDSYTGSTDRLLSTNPDGRFGSSIQLTQLYLSNEYIQALLSDPNSWTSNGEFIPNLTGSTPQGTRHYDANYLYEFVQINTVIRLARV
ncbi:MAG: hypothetical protein ACOC33_00235 [bacterium]